MELLSGLIGAYYGLDWFCMLMGFIGGWLVAHQNQTGFVFLIIAGCAGLCVAVMADQSGFIAANLINMLIAAKGLSLWARTKHSTRSTTQQSA